MSTETTGVDVVIPTLGRPSLSRALDSVRAQTGPDNADVRAKINVFVVAADRDAGSVVHGLIDGCGLPVTMVQGDGWGPGQARNAGLDAGRAPYVAFLDDDDWWEPAKITRQLAALTTRPQAPLCFTDSWFIRPTATTRVPLRRLGQDQDLLDFILSRRRLRYGDGFVQSSSLLVRRRCAQQERWDDTLHKHEDWDFVVRLCRRFGAPVQVREPLVHVPQGSTGSLSQQADPAASQRWLDSVARRPTREVGDFLASEVLRGHLRRLDFAAAGALTPQLLRARPHLAALTVGLSGLARR